MSYSSETPPHEMTHSTSSQETAPPAQENPCNDGADTGASAPPSDGTSIDVVASTQDAGLTADVNVVNLDALGLLNDGISADVSADILHGGSGDGGIDLALSVDTGGLDLVGGALDLVGGTPDLGDIGGLPDTSCFDVCSLADHVGV
jgi:hypothetical protein